jgi:hypothetical protein
MADEMGEATIYLQHSGIVCQTKVLDISLISPNNMF